LVSRPLHVRTFRALLLCVIALLITTCTDQPTTPTSESGPPSQPLPPAPASVTPNAVVLVGAGNIARCDRTGDEQTALLLDGIPGAVFTAGDNIWASGTLADYQNCYNPNWGRHKSRTRPAAGDLDYQTLGAAGYYQYFGAAAGDSGKGYYSYDLGEWHIVVLNSSISMTAASPQVTWLKADLAANPRQCTLAYWDLPRFSSRGTAVRAAVKPLWDALYAGGAEVILNTHYRVYERFAPQNPAGALDTDLGMRQFIVGTGGHVAQSFGSVVPNSEARISGVFGVLKLSLDAGVYAWEFVPVAGQTASEAGSGTCHRRPGEPAQNQAPTARPGGPYAAEGTVAFNGSGSFDPDNNLPLTYAWDFGDGTTGTGVAPTKAYGANGPYTVTLVVTDALGLASAPATATATIGNLPPAVNAGADAAVDLGTAFSLNATFTDPGGAGDTPWSWTIAWGDGATQSGSSPTLGGPIAVSHTYGAVGQFTVAVTVTDKDGGAGSDNTVVTVSDPTATAVLAGAGDIAVCGSSGDEQTASLLDGIAGTVITLGDNVYTNGTPTEFANCYDPSWGRHKARTKPAPGNHDYNTANATGYFGYFGALAGDPAKGYYSYEAGPWHVIVLNSGTEDAAQTAAGSPQEQWLRADLAASTKMCTVAYWHHPLWTSVQGRNTNTAIRPLWNALYELGADLIINGHDHVYERFAPMRPDGTADATFGLRQITVGVGGEGTYNFGNIGPNSEVRDNSTLGVIKLTLSATGYAWQFIPVPGGTFMDAGSGNCHGRPGGPPPPNQAPTANAGGPYTAEASVTFNGAGSSDPDNNLPLTYAWNFGDGTTGTGVSPVKTYATNGSYTATLVVTDALGLASAPASASVTIANVAPAVNAGSDAVVSLGTAFSLNATFTDPGGASDAPWAWTVAWGDGASDNGSTSTLGGPITGSHVYGAAGTYTIHVTVTDKDGGVGADDAVATVTPPGTEQVFVGAGNIASCSAGAFLRAEATAKLLDATPGTVFTAGDNAFPNGLLSEYQNCYQPNWGRHKARTYATLGNHEYNSGNANGAFDYFGDRVGPRGLGYYSYDLGDWHVIHLNDNIGFVSISAGSAQDQWLVADLAASTKQCVIAIWHTPLFLSSDETGYIDNPSRKILWDRLYAAGADVVINAQQHHYERFAPMRPDATPDAQFGLRSFNVGTGGESIAVPTRSIHPSSQVRGGDFGVLKLTLSAGGYSWAFLPIAGATFTDAGSGTCHGRPGGGPPPNQAPTASPGGPYAADANVTFNGTGSSDPDNNLPLTYAWTFGDGTTGSGASPAKTYTTDGSYTATLVVTDALGLASAPASTGVTIANVVPAVNAGADASPVLGTAFQLAATFSDPGGADDAPWAWSITWGDGSTQSGSAATAGGISASHTYAAAGTFTVQVSVTDQDGGTGSDQATVTVLASPLPNQAPTARPGGPYSADAIVAFNGATSSDPDNNLPLTYAWTFGDGATGSGVTPSHTYAAAGSYTVTLVVTDALGLASAPASTSATIANVVPAVSAGPDVSVNLGAPFNLNATFTDPGGATDAPWSWTIAWGDGASAAGSTSVLGGPIAASHTYVAPGAYTVQVSVTDKDGGTGTDGAVVTVTDPAAAVVIVGAGNSTRCDLTDDEKTALLLDGIAGTVFTTGDNVRASGSLADFQSCYDPTWGRQKARTRPAAGDLDYQTAGAAGYFSYFGAAAGTAGQGYYSYDLGAWHIIVLNSNISMAVGSAQEVWLKADLAANARQCVLAYWHHPRFSSYSTAVRPEVKPLWDALYAAGADVVLNGHYRLYERFAPQTPAEVRDDATGIRQFTVGTGGHGVEPFGTPRPNSEVRSSGTFGVLKLTLRATGYDWQFVPVAGQTFTDAGTTACH
jgi:PKD repeat protein